MDFMTDPDYLANFAKTYFSQDAGKTVDLSLLRAWLSCEHFHADDDENAVVYSMDLDRWARKAAK